MIIKLILFLKKLVINLKYNTLLMYMEITINFHGKIIDEKTIFNYQNVTNNDIF